ncbi:hypothetical protein E4U22_007388 [Claviceps purpurea]|nr:hypothetical protein E4U22_007388 [Claviceps purpurea]
MSTRWTRQDKIKRAVFSVSIAAVILVGVITGAQLKTDKQKNEAVTKIKTTPLADQIAYLEEQKRALLQQRSELENKLQHYKDRMVQRKAGREAGENEPSLS